MAFTKNYGESDERLRISLQRRVDDMRWQNRGTEYVRECTRIAMEWIDGACWSYGLNPDMSYSVTSKGEGLIEVEYPKITKRKKEQLKGTLRYAKKFWQDACEIKIKIVSKQIVEE